uniref:VQ domain-containing protein n=2 Tax=Cajanus cajan TaxID=3821 RepID=A0A151S681_CAJCA|nr:hypothetical protein KK1_027970 [Cajanus cajan]
MTATADQCMQFYQQPLMDGMAMDLGFMDATMSSSEGILSPSNSHNKTASSGHHLTPKGGAIFKPIRRRSRASKRTPITLLKANTSNFRALVQQFTGCPTTITTMSLAIHKGPITLNFQQGGKQQIQHHAKITRAMPPFGSISSNNQVHQVSVPLPWHHKQPEQLPKQQLMQEQQSNSLPSSGNSYRPISCMDDGFLFDNDSSLQELTLNAISNDIHGLFM